MWLLSAICNLVQELHNSLPFWFVPIMIIFKGFQACLVAATGTAGQHWPHHGKHHYRHAAGNSYFQDNPAVIQQDVFVAGGIEIPHIP